MTTLAFVDCETLGLNPDKHPMWELAVIRRANDTDRGTDTEHLWQIRPDEWEIKDAEPEALAINHFNERMILPEGVHAAEMLHPCGVPHPMKLNELRAVLGELLGGAVLVGSNPAFDASFLQVFLNGTPWHYRTVDIATLGAGYVNGQAASSRHLGGPVSVPFSSRTVSRLVGVEPPGPGVAHTALGDARWARDVYDAVTGGVR